MVLLLLLRWKKEKKRCNKWHSCFFEKFEKYKDVEKNQHKCFPEIIFTSKKIAGIVLFFLPRNNNNNICVTKKNKTTDKSPLHTHVEYNTEKHTKSFHHYPKFYPNGWRRA
jgi:hypothetical protein